MKKKAWNIFKKLMKFTVCIEVIKRIILSWNKKLIIIKFKRKLAPKLKNKKKRKECNSHFKSMNYKITTGTLIRSTTCWSKDVGPARTILMQLNKKSLTKIQIEQWEVEKAIDKILLEFSKTVKNQNIDKRVSKKSAATILMMTTKSMMRARW